MEQTYNTVYCFRDDKQKEGGRPAVDVEREEHTQPVKAIFCKACGSLITGREKKIAVNGSHTHTFFNPAGIVFELGCFSDAPGCHLAGEATSEFTWFADHVWRFALCRSCNVHLGWFFESGEKNFYGLILATLTE